MTDIYNLIRQAHSGDKNAERKLTDDNMALVYSSVRKLIRPGFDFDDLVQVGSIGLIKAIRRFDTSLGLRLSTYAVPLIIGEIKRYMRDDSTLKVSRSLRELWIKAVHVREALSAQLSREPTVGEISERLSCSVEELTMAMEACMPCESLWQKIGGGDNETCVADVVKDKFSTEDELEKLALKEAINSLGERDKKIIILRYFRGKTQMEVSEIIGVSQVQISRIEKKVLSMLRKSLE